MTRFVNSTAQTAADQPHVVYAMLVSLDFVSGFIRAFNGAGTLVFNGNTYTGVGHYGSIDVVGESTDLRPANPVTMTLSGVPDSVLGLMAAAAGNRADYFGRSARVDICFFDSSRNLLTPIENAVWEGQMDQLNVSRADRAIQLICEDRMVIFDKTSGVLYTDEWEQSLYSGDTFFNQIPFLQNIQLNWGGAPTNTGNGGGGGTGGRGGVTPIRA
jgi:hypothetical protein